MLVVEDDPATADGLRRYLAHEGWTVDVADDGLAALDLLRSRAPDALLLDLMLPGLDGLSLCRRVREASGVPILMLTARTREDEIVRGLDAGADDYVLKPFRPREVVARVRALLRRGASASGGGAPHADDRVLAWGTLRLDARAHRVTHDGRELALTPTEFALLDTFLRHPERVLTRARLIELALGHGYDGLERTLDTHVLNLRRKLGDDARRPTLIETVVGVGYRLRSEAP